MREERRRHWLEDPRWQRLVLGDWNPVIRDPIDLMRAALLIGSVLLAFLDKNLEAAPLITVLVVLVPRILDLPRPLDAAVVVGMSIQAWGNLFDFFNRYGWYDDVVHFLVPMLTCAATYVVLARLEIVPPPDRSYLRRHDLGVFLVTFLIGLGYAALYEIYEAGADAVFDSNLQESLADTNTDLLFGALGSAVGANALVVWSRRGWGELHRLPAEQVVERMVDPEKRASRARARADAGAAKQAVQRSELPSV